MRTVPSLLLAAALGALSCAEPLAPDQDPGPPTDPALSTASWPNEPIGLTVLTDRGFSSKARAFGDVAGAEGWSTDERLSANFTIVQDLAAPYSPSAIGQIVYPAGFSGGGPGAATFYFNRAAGNRALHIGLWVRLSDNFQGNRAKWNVLSSLWIARSPRVRFAAAGTGDQPLTPAVVLNSAADRRGILLPAAGAAAQIVRGRWQRWEVVLIANTPGQRDGVLRWWIDGAKVMDYSDLAIVAPGQSDVWETFLLQPEWNGGDIVRSAMSFQFDHARIAGSPNRDVSAPPVPAPVASIAVALDSTSLVVGQRAQAVAVLRDSAGAVLTGRTVVWSSSAPEVATVSGTGLVEARARGTASIVATSEGRSGSATIEVRDAPAPIPPPVGAAGDTIFRDDFESGSLAAWQDGVNPTLHRIVSDANLARSGTRALQVSYPAGSNGGGFLTRFFMPGYDSVYVSYWVRLAPDWQGGSYLTGLYGSRIDNQWSAFGKAGVCPSGTDYFTTFLYAEYSGNPGPARFASYYPSMPRSGGSCWGHDGAGVARYDSARLTPGSWHRVEFWVRLNTPGRSDAVQRFWIDGVLAGEWSGLSFRSTTDLRLNALQLTFYASTGVTQARTLHIDDVVVKAVAPSAPPPPPPPPPPAAVASVTVSPASVTLDPGGTTQLQATLRDAAGALLTGRTVTWTSSSTAVATVGADGRVTAVSAGSATITATSEGQSGRAAVTVSAPPPPPPPPPGGASWPNEPSGMTAVSDYGFERLDQGWRYSPAHPSGFGRIVEDPTAPASPQSVLEFVYPTGFTGGGYAPGTVYAPAPFPDPTGSRNVREIFWGFHWKANAEWQNHESNINKLGYGWIANATTFGLTWHWGREFRKGMALFAGGSYWHFNTPQAFPLEPGNWYRIEVHFRPSSASGRADGALRIWVNGVLCADHPAIVTPAGYISNLYFSPTWGGLGTTAKAHTDYFRFDHVRLSVR